MKTFARLALAAVLVLVLAACASSSGQPWTPPPAPAETEAPAETAPPASVAPSDVPASVAPSGVPASAAPSAVPATAAPASPGASGAPSVAPSAGSSAEPAGRVIELEMNAALQILQGGVQVKDIPVTPGETIMFKVVNTAGYDHNFFIGTDTDLMTNNAAALVGIPTWKDAEPREFTWVVPDDVTGLKYGCTVPGHYMLMNGTFSSAG